MFQDIPVGQQYPTNVAVAEGNKGKNRYKDMYACKYQTISRISSNMCKHWLILIVDWLRHMLNLNTVNIFKYINFDKNRWKSHTYYLVILMCMYFRNKAYFPQFVTVSIVNAFLLYIVGWMWNGAVCFWMYQQHTGFILRCVHSWCMFQYASLRFEQSIVLNLMWYLYQRIIRYYNVLDDHSRVVLKTLKGVPSSDYINACHVDVSIS